MSSSQMPAAAIIGSSLVYNYREDVWSFVDLPNASAATNVNISNSLTYTLSRDDDPRRHRWFIL